MRALFLSFVSVSAVLISVGAFAASPETSPSNPFHDFCDSRRPHNVRDYYISGQSIDQIANAIDDQTEDFNHSRISNTIEATAVNREFLSLYGLSLRRFRRVLSSHLASSVPFLNSLSFKNKIPLEMGTNTFYLNFDEDGENARYLVAICRIEVLETEIPDEVIPDSTPDYLKTPNSHAGDSYGLSGRWDMTAASSSNYVVVGVPGESNAGVTSNDQMPLSNNGLAMSGASFIYDLSEDENNNQPIAYLKASDVQVGAQFGFSVDIDENIVVVGAPGANAVYVFKKQTNGYWLQTAQLFSQFGSHLFGIDVAVSGNTVVVGTRASGLSSQLSDNGESDTFGSVEVFEINSLGEWEGSSFEIRSHNGDTQDYFGGAVDISGDTIVVGSEGEDSAFRGIISGSPLVYPGQNELNNSSNNSGAVYIFKRSLSGTDWLLEAYIKSSVSFAGIGFGHDVSIDSATLVVGASNADKAFVYRKTENSWNEDAVLQPAPNQNGSSAAFGVSVSISNNRIIVGAPSDQTSLLGLIPIDDDLTLISNLGSPFQIDAGAAYVFENTTPQSFEANWTPIYYLKPTHEHPQNLFGNKVSLSDSVMTSVAPADSFQIYGLDENHDSPDSGAIYVFH